MFKRSAFIFLLAASMILTAENGMQTDVFKAAGGALRITFIGHASLLFQYRGPQQLADLNIYVDPDGRLADFSRLPKADLILVSHQHGDHFDARAIEALLKPGARRGCSLVVLHRLRPLLPERELERAELVGLEATARLEPVAEGEELERRHRLEDVELGDEHLEDGEHALERVTNADVIARLEQRLEPVELVQDLLEPELVDLVHHDEQRLVVLGG